MSRNVARGTIIIVDDEPANNKMLASLLEEASYVVHQAMCGEKALEIIENSPPDLLLLDVKMPKMDGFEVCRRMRSVKTGIDIPVIFISSLTDTASRVTGFELGAVDYIPKPFDPIEVLARVKTHLSIRQMRKRLEVHGDMQMQAREILGKKVSDKIEELEKSNEALQRKNIALQELMDGIKDTQKKLSDNIVVNINEGVMPILRALEQCLESKQKTMAQQAIQGLQEVTSPFLNSLSHQFATLTPTEARICMLICRDLGSKEIAAIEGRSFETIRAHRRSIRKKLGLTDTNINLSTYLQSVKKEIPYLCKSCNLIEGCEYI